MNPAAEKLAGAQGAAEQSVAPIAQLTLPAAISVNEAWHNTPRGRARTKLYRDWLGHAGWRLREQRPPSFTGPVLVLIGVERANLRADIDNRIKPTLDLLVEHGVLADDRQVIGVAAAWSPQRDSLMRVAIIPAADLAVRFHLASDRLHGGWFISEPSEEEGPSCPST